MSRPHLPTRVVVYPAGSAFKAEVKGRGVRVFLGTFPTAELAAEAGARYMVTGQKPPPKKRGPKRGQKQRKPRAGRARPPEPTFTPPVDRTALWRAALARIS